MSKLTYLACPYNHPDPSVRAHRFETVCRKAAELMSQGVLVFSPLSHNIPILEHGLPLGWDFWAEHDSAMLLRCDRLLVLRMSGWESSIGVQSEIQLAEKNEIPVEFIEVS